MDADEQQAAQALEAFQNAQQRWMAEYKGPALNKDAFICPHCDAFAHQEWFELYVAMPPGPGFTKIDSWVSRCAHCKHYAYWVDERLVYPPKRLGPLPHSEMPAAPRADYEEAREIAALSPRGACALLRLALQKLCTELGEKGKDLNADIASLVKEGLRVEVQQALDTVRVIGNNAVHPGEFDVTDDLETATTMFECMNIITEQMIAQPRKMQELYGKLPMGQRDAIDERDR